MGNVKLIDCTIHEGGYKNQWKFCENEKQLQGLIGELSFIGADIIDIGLVGKKKHEEGNCCYEVLSQIPIKYLYPYREYSVTIEDYDNIDNENFVKIPKVNYIRLVISIDNSVEKIKSLCRKIHEKTYKLIICIEIKPENSLDEICKFISRIDVIDILVFDDILGRYKQKELVDFFEKVDHILKDKIDLGFRGRNTRYQVQGIIESLIESILKKRNFVIEASVLGISRNVSLAELEIEGTWLNDKYNGKYNFIRIEKVADTVLKSVNYDVTWKTDRFSTTISDCSADFSYRDIVDTTKVTSEELPHVLHELSFDEHKYIDLKIFFQKLTNYRKLFYKNKLAVIIWVDRVSDDLLDVYLRKQIANIAQSKIDVYICNKASVDKNRIYEKYLKLEISNLYYIKDTKKIMYIIDIIIKNYEYIWINQPEYIIRFDQVGSVLDPLIREKSDVIVVENDWKETGNRGIYSYDNNIEFFRRYFINLYAVGTVVYSSNFLKKIFSEYNFFDLINEIVLVEKLFIYIVKNSINCIGCIDEIYDIQNLNHIFGIDYYIDKWTVKLERLMRELPVEYKDYKEEIMNLKGGFWDPFTKQRIINLKMNDMFYITNKKEVIASKNLFIAKIPKMFGLFLLSNKDKKIGIFAKCCIKKIKNICCNIEKSFGKYDGIDFEEDVCCIVPQDEIPSKLVYGNLNYIQDPWITIVIPVYKRADLLEDTIDSVLGQDDIGYFWDIVVVDNEEIDEGDENEIERLIRKINNPRILYYRNKKNLGVSGNYNRGIELARGKWISMLHSDDLLVKGYLTRIEKILKLYTKKIGKEVGYISSTYLPFYSESIQEDSYWKTELKIRDEEIYERQKKRKPILIRVRRSELIITGVTGISLPSNGTIMNRKAILEMGGFNDNLGICADMVLPLRLMKKYAVYRTDEIMGHYRVGKRNISASNDNSYKVEKNYCEIREYFYQKNIFGRIMGYIFRQQHFFIIDIILNNAYWKDKTIQSLYEFRKQPIRDKIIFSKYGPINLFYKFQRFAAKIKVQLLICLNMFRISTK